MGATPTGSAQYPVCAVPSDLFASSGSDQPFFSLTIHTESAAGLNHPLGGAPLLRAEWAKRDFFLAAQPRRTAQDVGVHPRKTPALHTEDGMPHKTSAANREKAPLPMELRGSGLPFTGRRVSRRMILSRSVHHLSRLWHPCRVLQRRPASFFSSNIHQCAGGVV